MPEAASRNLYLKACFAHSKKNWVVAIVTLLSALYSLTTSITPFVEWPAQLQVMARLPKLPLTWAVIIVLVCIAFIVGEGGWRFHNATLMVHGDELAAQEAKIALLKSVAPEAEITIEEIYRENLSELNQQNVSMRSHIFVQARIELKSPITLSTSDYELELLIHGSSRPTRWVDDVNDWQVAQRHSPGTNAIDHTALQPLAKHFHRGRPVEGWLHFATSEDIADYFILQGYVRLIVNSPHGPLSDETDGDYWNHDQNMHIVPK